MILSIMIGLMLLAAWAYAGADADATAANQHIDHSGGWMERAGFALICAVCLSLIGDSWWMFIGLLIVAYGVFTPAFRFLINRARGLHWNYIAPGNEYDWMFLRPFMHPIDRTECVEAWHVYMASRSALQAGHVAYLVEFAALILGIYITTL